jgi:hypothetical protein
LARVSKTSSEKESERPFFFFGLSFFEIERSAVVLLLVSLRLGFVFEFSFF